MSDKDTQKALNEAQALIGILTDLVYDATIRIEILRAIAEKNGFPSSEFERVFRETKTNYEGQLKHASTDLRMQAILKYIEGDETPTQ